jgi:hypothetical protein
VATLRSLVSAFETRVNDSISEHATSLVSGSAADFADYKRVCGIVAGLELALEILKQTLEQVDR